MHAVVMQSLEEFLSGTLNPAAQQDIEAHLKGCDSCRSEIRSMQEVSEWFGSLRPEEPVAPAPGFYSRVMQQVEQQRVVPSLANLFGSTGDQELKGSGTIGRSTVISTTLGTRVVRVLPNGYLVIEGVKEIRVSSEQQVITVRGVVRPADLSPGNVVQSDLIAQLEVSVNGKGVVGDAIKRPFFLYRLLLGLLPF